MLGAEELEGRGIECRMWADCTAMYILLMDFQATG
jgi:hypothetical protein